MSKMSSFIYSQTNVKEIESLLSSDRFETYLNLAQKDKVKALLKYKENIILSQRLYAILHILEICLRNKIDTALKDKYGEEWYLSKNLKLSEYQKKTIQEAYKENTQKRGIHNLKRGHLIASLMFGFWTAFFDRDCEELWRHELRKIFDLSPPLQRKTVSYTLQELRILRNRIAHHECILRMDYKDLETMALRLVSSLSPVATEWLSEEIL